MEPRTTLMRGNPLPLTGPELKVGDAAPDFRLHHRSPDGLKELTLADYEGKTLMLNVVLSVDTPICEMQSKRFNEEVISLPASVEVLTVSMDLPFAQARFCSEKQVHHLQLASDHREAAFGAAYGVLIESLRLLSRAVFVVGPDRTLRYVEYVPEVTDQPNYDAALAVVREQLD